MRKFDNFRSNINDRFRKSRAFQLIWHFFLFCFSLSGGFYFAIKFKDPVIDLIKTIDNPAKAHTFADWCIFGVVAIIALLITCFFVLLGAYAKNRLLEILKEEFAYKEIRK